MSVYKMFKCAENTHNFHAKKFVYQSDISKKYFGIFISESRIYMEITFSKIIQFIKK